MDSAVLLEVIPPAETFGTDGARERPQSCVDSLVPGQFLVACKRLSARFFVAFERSFTYNVKTSRLRILFGALAERWTSTCVTADMSFKLAVVAKGHLAMRASEPFWSLLLVQGRGGCGMSGRKDGGSQRLEAGQLVQLADVVRTHSKSGEPGWMQHFRSRFQ